MAEIFEIQNGKIKAELDLNNLSPQFKAFWNGIDLKYTVPVVEPPPPPPPPLAPFGIPQNFHFAPTTDGIIADWNGVQGAAKYELEITLT